MRSRDRIGFSNSTGSLRDRWCSPRSLLVMSLADCRRDMEAIKNFNANRDVLWPRNYRCWIRAPERLETGVRQQ